jgi:hypothetical protein
MSGRLNLTQILIFIENQNKPLVCGPEAIECRKKIGIFACRFRLMATRFGDGFWIFPGEFA